MTNLVSKTADFFIRMTIICSTALFLLYMGTVRDQVGSMVLFWLFLLAIIIKGVSDIFESRKHD